MNEYTIYLNGCVVVIEAFDYFSDSEFMFFYNEEGEGLFVNAICNGKSLIAQFNKKHIQGIVKNQKSIV